MEIDAHRDVVVMMGVSGSGKSVIGSRLADSLGAEFVEGDDLHPLANTEKMAAGQPLGDQDREPWLANIAEVINQYRQQGVRLVIACSALRRGYRDQLRTTGPLTFVLLQVRTDELKERVRARHHAFMPPELLAGQLAAFELPAPDETDVVVVSSRPDPTQTVAAVLGALGAG